MTRAKRVKIEPVKVLQRATLSGENFKEIEVVGLYYKQKTRPEFIDSEGNRIYVFANKAVYKDTEHNRDLLNLAQKMEQTRNQLNKKISETLDQAERVQVHKLHERTIEEL